MKNTIRRIAGNRHDTNRLDYYASFLDDNFSSEESESVSNQRTAGFRPSGDLNDTIADGMPVFLASGIRVSEALGHGQKERAAKAQAAKTRREIVSAATREDRKGKIVREASNDSSASPSTPIISARDLNRYAGSTRIADHQALYERFQNCERSCPSCRKASLAIDDLDANGESWEWVCPRERTCGFRESGPASYLTFLASSATVTAMRKGHLGSEGVLGTEDALGVEDN